MLRYHVVAVLGKRLRGGITKEYASRIDFLISEMETGRLTADLIGFSGGKTGDAQLTEAEAGETYFNGLVKDKLSNIPTTFLDPCAKDTIENVNNILSRVQKTVKYAWRDVALTLASSDYHLERLEIID